MSQPGNARGSQRARQYLEKQIAALHLKLAEMRRELDSVNGTDGIELYTRALKKDSAALKRRIASLEAERDAIKPLPETEKIYDPKRRDDNGENAPHSFDQYG